MGAPQTGRGSRRERIQECRPRRRWRAEMSRCCPTGSRDRMESSTSKHSQSPDAGVLVVQLNWRDIEPSEGQFDFSKADAEVRAAISQGKRIALVLRFQAGLILSGSSDKCAWNYAHAQLLPRWVGDALGSSDSFCSGGTTLTIPKYWGAPFITLWTSYVSQVAAHFAPFAPYVAYVRAPVGLGDEGKVITGPNSKPKREDLQRLLQWGYNPQLWEAWQEDMLLFYRQAFPYSPWVLYTINQQDINDKCTDPVPVIQTDPVLAAFARTRDSMHRTPG